MLIHKRLRELIKGVEIFILGKSLLSVCISLTYIFQALLFGQIIQMVYMSSSLDEMKWKALQIIFLIFIRLVLIILTNMYAKWIIGQVKNRLRKRCFKKLMRLGPAYLLDERSGEVQSQAMAGIDYLEGYISLYIPQILTVILLVGAISIYIFRVNYLIGGIALAGSISAIYMPYFFLYKITNFSEEHWTAYTDLSAEFVESVQGMMTLKAFNASKRVGNKLKGKMYKLFEKTMQSLKISLIETGLADFCIAIGKNMSLALAAYFAAKGTISLGQMASLFFLLAELFRPQQELSMYFHQGFMGITSCDGLFEILDREEPLKDPAKSEGQASLSFKAERFDIDFDNVNFSYPGSKTRLFENLDFHIKEGERIAFAGESGSGKTTISRLLLRFYDPEGGAIKIGGQDIREIPLTDLRNIFSVVSQETYLFHGTIMENLLLANPNATEADIVRAAKTARIHDFIAGLPLGYRSPVGEKGVNFSGGQCQRIAIARAILKDAPVIIFDEASSSVDVENEKEINENLREALKGKTSITIAHRLSTIEEADRIYVMQDGIIREEGRHGDLIGRDSYYRRLFEAQEYAEKNKLYGDGDGDRDE